jgi:hypothetical protein
VKLDSKGSGFALWGAQKEGDSSNALWTSRFDAATGFGEPRAQPTTDQRLISSKAIAFRANGSAFAIWDHYGPGYAVWAAQYDGTTRDWRKPVLIYSDPREYIQDLQITVDSEGTARAFWLFERAAWTAVFN